MNFKRLSLTDIKIDIPRVPKKKSLISAMEAAGTLSIEVMFFLNIYICVIVSDWLILQMLRTSGKIAHGAGN